MNLKLFFAPPEIEFDLPNNTLGKAFHRPQRDDFDIVKMDLALVGIRENRGCKQPDVNLAADEIRKNEPKTWANRQQVKTARKGQARAGDQKTAQSSSRRWCCRRR